MTAALLPPLLTGHYHEGSSYHTWRPRGTADHLLIFTVAGAGRFGVPGGHHCSQPGELTLLRPGVLHDYGTEPAVGHWELLWVHFSPRPHWNAWMNWPEAADLPGLRLEDEHAAGIERLLKHVHAFATGGRPHREAWAMHALEEVWLRCAVARPASPLDPRVERAASYLRAHLALPLNPQELALHCQLSLSRLRHLFAGQTGLSLLAFLEAERLNRAAHLLILTSRSVASIAEEVGYPDPLYFSRRFRARLGRSPRQYRQDAGG